MTTGAPFILLVDDEPAILALLNDLFVGEDKDSVRMRGSTGRGLLYLHYFCQSGRPRYSLARR
jgi:hypothetical protein